MRDLLAADSMGQDSQSHGRSLGARGIPHLKHDVAHVCGGTGQLWRGDPAVVWAVVLPIIVKGQAERSQLRQAAQHSKLLRSLCKTAQPRLLQRPELMCHLQTHSKRISIQWYVKRCIRSRVGLLTLNLSCAMHYVRLAPQSRGLDSFTCTAQDVELLQVEPLQSSQLSQAKQLWRMTR